MHLRNELYWTTPSVTSPIYELCSDNVVIATLNVKGGKGYPAIGEFVGKRWFFEAKGIFKQYISVHDIESGDIVAKINPDAGRILLQLGEKDNFFLISQWSLHGKYKIINNEEKLIMIIQNMCPFRKIVAKVLLTDEGKKLQELPLLALTGFYYNISRDRGA
ncbi:MAG: hypothetical protein K6U74_03380 [Firmicutes bacterium]|nr:hypothetical protein [Bacillota bacterium]